MGRFKYRKEGVRRVEQNRADWSAIARNPKFKELRRRKEKFLFGWWIVSAVIFVIFLVVANLGRKVYGWCVIGDINLGYLLVLALFVYCWFIAGYYASWANRFSDKMTADLVEELKQGGIKK
ncbi:MAG: DUF485 domain-containing protein [Desulfomonilaceae bacterium]